MTDEHRDDRPLGYWSQLENSQKTVRDAITEKCHDDDWTPHAVVVAGEGDDGEKYGLVIRSKVGDEGLLLSERYVVIPADVEKVSDIRWLSQGITRRVSGPIAQGLVRAYARADNDRFAADEHPEPLALSALGDDLDDEPDSLLSTLADSPEKERKKRAEARAEASGKVCENCGQPITGDGVNLGSALGKETWIHAGSCPQEEDDDE